MVGHTHEDVDQFFSRISTHLNKRNICSPIKLFTAIPRAHTKVHTTTERILHVFNVKDWLAPHQHAMYHHSKPHLFKFTRNNEGKAVLHTKDWSTSEWVEPTGSVTPLHSLPEGQPNMANTLHEDLFIDLMERDTRKVHKYMDAEDIASWQDLFIQLRAEEAGIALFSNRYHVVLNKCLP